MKTGKRIAMMVLALIMVMSMGTWAAELSANEAVDWGLEKGINTNKDGWKVQHPWDGTNVIEDENYVKRNYSEDSANVHGGTYSLRLHADETYDVASVYVSVPRPACMGTTGTSTAVANITELFEGYIKITELTEDSCVEVMWYRDRLDGSAIEIAKFTAATDGWEKISGRPSWWDSSTYTGYILLRIKGKGTVYFDDMFCGVKDTILRNGDFEVGDITKVPTNWSFTQIQSNGATWGAEQAFWLSQDTSGNRYCSFQHSGKAKIGYIYMPISITAGAKYKITFRHKAFLNDVEVQPGILPLIGIGTAGINSWYKEIKEPTFTYTFLGEDAAGWNLYEGTCTIPDTSGSAQNLFVVNTKTGWDRAYLDDLTLSIDSTPVIVKAEDGKSVTATSHVVALQDRPTALFVGAYKKDENGNLCLVNLSSVSTEAVAAGQTQKLEKTIDLPEDENEYVVRAFLWDGISTLGAQTASVTLTN